MLVVNGIAHWSHEVREQIKKSRLEFGLSTWFFISLTIGFLGAAAPTLVIVIVMTFLGSMCVAIAGIDWDVRRFATFDQLVNTAGIPLGMLLFGVFAYATPTVALGIVVLLVGCAGVCLLMKG